MPEQRKSTLADPLASTTIDWNDHGRRGYRLRDEYLKARGRQPSARKRVSPEVLAVLWRRFHARQLRIFMTNLLEAGRLNQYRVRRRGWSVN